jgi:hypothetical protein
MGAGAGAGGFGDGLGFDVAVTGGPFVVGVDPGGSGCFPLAMSSVVDFFVR